MELISEASQALLRAAQQGDALGAARALRDGADADAVDTQDDTALGIAIREGHVDVATLLLASGARTDRVTSDGDAALTCAVRHDQFEVLDAMLHSPNAPIDASEAALALACKLGYSDVVASLLQVRPSSWSGGRALIVAVEHNHGEIVDQLVEAGANIEYTDNFTQRPLHTAVSRGNTALVRVLLRAGANVNAMNHGNNTGLTALMLAASKGHVEIVEVLLAVDGLDVNQESFYWNTALLSAAEAGHLDILEMLLAAGANIHHVDCEGMTILIRAMTANVPDMALIERLLALGVPTDARDETGTTALMYASLGGNVAAAERLLAASVSVTEQDLFGRSALSFACQMGNEHMVELLLAWGACVDETDSYGETLLMAAVQNHRKVVSTLLAAGADVNAVDSKGNSVLLHAVRKMTPIIPTLIAHGADINHTNHAGESARSLIETHRFPEAEEALRAATGVDLARNSSIAKTTS